MRIVVLNHEEVRNLKAATFRVRTTDQVKRAWRRAALRYSAKTLRKWGMIDAAMLLDGVAENIMYDVPPARTPSEEWG